MTIRLIDQFTTRDGSWEPSSLPYSIPPNYSLMYGGGNIPGKGAANHIMVKARPGDRVAFNTADGTNPALYMAESTGWVNHPMMHSSAYVPARGESGPWVVWVNGEKIAEGIGLPDGLHVSTWLITGEGEPVLTEPSTPQPNPITQQEYLEWARFYIDKALEMTT